MDKLPKVFSSFVLAGSRLFALCCLMVLTAGQAAALSWRDAPIMGTYVNSTVAGQFTVTVDGNPVVIPDSNALPSQSIFTYNPTFFDGSHWLDPTMSVWAASSVYVNLDSDYTYTGNWAFLGNGPNAAYNFDFPTDVWQGSWGFTTAELYSSIGQFWLEDAGNWRYTETWTGTSGSDNGVSITSTRDFQVAAIPEPETYAMLLAGLGLLGFMARRRKQKAA